MRTRDGPGFGQPGGELANILIRIELVDAAAMPHRKLDAYAICSPGDVLFVVRADIGAQRVAAALNRLGALI